MKKLIWQVISRAPREMTLSTLNGLLTFNTRDRVLGKELFSSGNYEWNTIATVIDTLRRHSPPKGRLMVDVGANIGMISIACLSNGFFEEALAFEPESYNFHLLQRNINQNNLASKIECYNYALSSRSGVLDLEISKDNFGDHRLRTTPYTKAGFYHEEKRRTSPVQAMKLDDMVSKRTELRNAIGLIWVDIQGHEGHFFSGARNTIRHKIPVVTEFWPYALDRAGTSRDEFMDLARDLFSGYFHIASPRPEWAAIENLDRLFDLYRLPREMSTILFV